MELDSTGILLIILMRWDTRCFQGLAFGDSVTQSDALPGDLQKQARDRNTRTGVARDAYQLARAMDGREERTYIGDSLFPNI